MLRSALIAALLALTLSACNKPAPAPVVEAPAAAAVVVVPAADAASAVAAPAADAAAPAAK